MCDTIYSQFRGAKNKIQEKKRMKKTVNIKKTFLLVLCIVLIAVTALFTNGCAKKPLPDGLPANVQAMGTGERQFYLVVIDKDSNESGFDIKTDKETVGAALLELGIIDGNQGQYGLYVTSVNGIVSDYDTDGTYWAFYVNGEYASSGVDSTDIVNGTVYSLRVEG